MLAGEWVAAGNRRRISRVQARHVRAARAIRERGLTSSC